MGWMDALKAWVAQLGATIAGFLGGFFVGSLREKNKQLKEDIKKAEENVEVANLPAKHGSDLIDGL